MTFSKIFLANLLVCLAIGAAEGLNARHKITQDNWVLDKLKESSFEIDGSKLTVDFPYGTYFNALYQGIVLNEKKRKYYWEFNCIENCFRAGVAKKDRYFPNNCMIEGAFYDSNLHNNGKTLVTEFGEEIE